MTRLTTDHILKDNQTRDPDSITSLALTHKALSDVTCLSDFRNLERLDLGFNNLTSLEGLKSCVNLKWLSVVQNKLQSLKGIEGLSKLAVLNAGKNKLRSMDEVRFIASLRALILNDNEIVTICRLDQLKELNTLVLSRNPIREIGESLLKITYITKLSLSNCQVQSVDLSLKSCAELKELRLAHNDIKALPAELANNKKLQNLDLGNNLITRWSDLKVLKSLVGLRNLNLQGNPIAANDKLAKKVRKSLPNLHIFNARPIDKDTINVKGDRVDEIDDDSRSAPKKHKVNSAEERDHTKEVNSKGPVTVKNEDSHMNIPNNLGVGKDSARKRNDVSDKLLKKEIQCNKDDSAVEKKLKKSKENQDKKGDGYLNGSRYVDMEKELEQKRNKSTKFSKKEVPVSVDREGVEKEKKKGSEEQGELAVIDDAEASFVELFSANVENPTFDGEHKMVNATLRLKTVDGSVTSSGKRKKNKSKGRAATLKFEEVEVGLGGPSTWGDD